MTKREAAIVSAYTGILLGDFGEMQRYVEALLGEPVFTHQFGNKETSDRIKWAATSDFVGIEVT